MSLMFISCMEEISNKEFEKVAKDFLYKFLKLKPTVQGAAYIRKPIDDFNIFCEIRRTKKSHVLTYTLKIPEKYVWRMLKSKLNVEDMAVEETAPRVYWFEEKTVGGKVLDTV